MNFKTWFRVNYPGYTTDYDEYEDLKQAYESGLKEGQFRGMRFARRLSDRDNPITIADTLHMLTGSEKREISDTE